MEITETILEDMEVKNLIIGAGIAGLAASYSLNYDCLIVEKSSTFGGLLDNINIEGFIFDQAVHLSFATEPEVRKIFDKTKFYNRKPFSTNYYSGLWLNHPVQTNLSPLKFLQKILILYSFITRPKKLINNYYDWLLVQYGHYFTINFPEKYTLKYWGESSRNLGYKWVGDRMYKPKFFELFKSIFFFNKLNNYYVKEMRYPEKGGYKSFISTLAEKSNVLYKHEIIKIDPIEKIAYLNGNIEIHYSNLISSMPLPMLIDKLTTTPDNLKLLSKKLYTTSIALVSIGFNKLINFPSIWFYVYDLDIPFARAYSPTLKSINNAPNGKSSLQCEVYFSKMSPLKFSEEELSKQVLDCLVKMKLISLSDVIFSRVNILKYANVVFYKGMEDDRDILLKYLSELNIKSIGRFGEWDYLWSNQSFMSGFKAGKLIK